MEKTFSPINLIELLSTVDLTETVEHGLVQPGEIVVGVLSDEMKCLDHVRCNMAKEINILGGKISNLNREYNFLEKIANSADDQKLIGIFDKIISTSYVMAGMVDQYHAVDRIFYQMLFLELPIIKNKISWYLRSNIRKKS